MHSSDVVNIDHPVTSQYAAGTAIIIPLPDFGVGGVFLDLSTVKCKQAACAFRLCALGKYSSPYKQCAFEQ